MSWISAGSSPASLEIVQTNGNADTKSSIDVIQLSTSVFGCELYKTIHDSKSTMVRQKAMLSNGQVGLRDEVIARAQYTMSQFLGMPPHSWDVHRLVTHSAAASCSTATEAVGKWLRSMEQRFRVLLTHLKKPHSKKNPSVSLPRVCFWTCYSNARQFAARYQLILCMENYTYLLEANFLHKIIVITSTVRSCL